jgi:hypothetical protein
MHRCAHARPARQSRIVLPVGAGLCRPVGNAVVDRGAAGQRRSPHRTARGATQRSNLLGSRRPRTERRYPTATFAGRGRGTIGPSSTLFRFARLGRRTRGVVARPTPVPSEESKRGTSTNRTFERPKRHRATRLRNPRDRARRRGRSDCHRSRTPSRRRRAIPQFAPVGRPRPQRCSRGNQRRRVRAERQPP